ncbi:intermembrane phospholipid transport protein YdbH family protein [Sphingomonas profundi]|uniref:intermembrane phospholipid transport protein YdbH family protein n=1 Tax=Alterirhizorhabdus profundi TaxID=2681549 RepID=UPI0012E8DE79|nr:YdbH domain-containing protein [Sphingomonas profundi]
MDEERARRPGRKRKAAAALGAVLALGVVGVWTQRKPIARGFVDDELRARGVPARYRIAALGPGVQRLTNVSIGDPAAPDLTADMVELRIGYGFGWPAVRSIRARGVRVRGRVVNGTLSLGAVDRLLPPPSGKPFALPDIAVDVADSAMRLETPIGTVGLAAIGRGNLADGFVGRLAASAPRLTRGGCLAERVQASLAIRIADARPEVSGPVRALSADCGGVSAQAVRADVTAAFSETLAPLDAKVRLASGAIARGAMGAAAVAGVVSYDGRDGRNRHGTVRLSADRVRSGGDAAGTVAIAGRYRVGAALAAAQGRRRPLRAEGEVRIVDASAAPARLRAIASALAGAGGTPVAPLARAIADAAGRANRALAGHAGLAFDGDVVEQAGTTALAGEMLLRRLDLASRSGARLAFAGEARVALPGGAGGIAGTASLAGGGFPAVRAALRPADGGIAGEILAQPYAAGGARLALAPLRFARPRGGPLRFATAVTLDGPLGDGRVTGLSLPVSGTSGAALLVNPGCETLRFAALAIAGIRFGPSRLPLCPVGGAMLRVQGGTASGGVAVPRPRLAGRVGSQPLTIAARDLRVGIGAPGFTASELAVRLGGAGGTRLDVVALAGRVDGGGIGGTFTQAAGRIANVPLLLSDGDGRWRLAGGRLGLAGRLRVADADAAPRFAPLTAPDVTLDLTGGVIRASGTLREPGSGLAISDVALTHDLANGRGAATLDVPGITFGPAFQPEALTRLTLGVVANVEGTVNGRGRIAWSPEGVTSTGDFATEGMNLAAVFGPVTGITTRIHFSDLLGLVTPPGQLVTVAAFNPGIAVEGGVIGYQLLPGQKVAVGGGKWPFSGGALILEPTVLDFGQPVERRMTFRVEGLQAGAFLQQFDFKNIAVTGTFDGSLPMIFDQSGGRIVGGRLVVRRGGGTLAYVGELTNKDLGMFGKLAFDALKSIRYDNLAIELDGALDSEIVSRIVFTGTNENPVEKKPKGLLRNLTGLPFKFNIVVRAPFRGLTSSAEAFVNPRGLIGNAAQTRQPPAATGPTVQPPLSEDKR